MAEYIEKVAFNYAIREAVKKYPNTFYNGLEVARQIAHDFPAADVRPVVEARWSEYEDELWGETIKSYCCSNCHHLISRTTIIRNFCPNCGADMRAQPPKEET